MKQLPKPLLLATICLAHSWSPISADENNKVLDAPPQPWKRRPRPILTASDPGQTWRRVVTYSPHVIHHDEKFHMWFLGTSTAARTNDIALGYAKSDDVIVWREHKSNPILRDNDIPWGKFLQTPFVLFDDSPLFKVEPCAFEY